MEFKLNFDFNKQPAWSKTKGASCDVVLSSRLRLARNYKEFNFVHLLSNEEKKQIIDKSENLFKKSNMLRNLNFIKLDDLTKIERYFLLERRVISLPLIDSKVGACIYDDDEFISIIVNEEDHLRIQVFQSGLDLKGLWHIINKIDDDIGIEDDYAYDNEFGFLTACPTNVGTGLRASVLVHLPCLVYTQQVGTIFKAISQLGMTVRGFYGEGTKSVGSFFQISNQITLGQSEIEIIEKIDKLTRQIIEKERQVRDEFYRINSAIAEDRIFRAYGILKNARIISGNEALELLSNVRLGINLGIIKNTLDEINNIMLMIQPAHIQVYNKKVLSPEQRDIARSQIIRNILK